MLEPYAVTRRKRAFFHGLHGTVLEFSPEADRNTPYYPQGIRVLKAGDTPLLSGSVDGVIGVHTLCVARDPQATLADVLRVLTSGGRYIFIEPLPRLRGFRRHHDPITLIESAGFKYLHIDHLESGLARSFIAGVAIKA